MVNLMNPDKSNPKPLFGNLSFSNNRFIRSFQDRIEADSRNRSTEQLLEKFNSDFDERLKAMRVDIYGPAPRY